MTFQELCEYIATDVLPDNDVPVQVPSGPPYIATPFGKRVLTLMREFCRLTHCCFSDRQAITLASGDREFNLMDPANCAKPVFAPVAVGINGAQVKKVQYSALSRSFSSVEVGMPNRWAVTPTDGVIVFDNQLNSTYPNSFVSGYFLHPNVTSDDAPIEPGLSQEIVALSRYVNVQLRLYATGENDGADRLSRLYAFSQNEMKEIKRRQLARGLS